MRLAPASLGDRLRRLMGFDSSVDVPQKCPPSAEKPPNAPRPATRFDAEVPVLPLPRVNRPFISFVIIVYSMPEQASRTLHSLSVDYQCGVNRDDYEIIVVENASPNMLGKEAALQCNAAVRYFRRDDGTASPVSALNFGAGLAVGSHIAYMIDGARLLTPGVVNYMINGAALSSRAIVAVPGYHLGQSLQQNAAQEGYDEATEARAIQSIDWPINGYRLFEIACLSGTSAGGYFKPIGESNCFCVPRELVEEVDGYDNRFVEVGGGQVNMDFYKRVVETLDSILVVLPGEGSFHQFHGGISTGGITGHERSSIMESYFAEYASIRGGPYEPPTKRTIFLGSLPDSALKFVRHGADRVINLNKPK